MKIPKIPKALFKRKRFLSPVEKQYRNYALWLNVFTVLYILNIFSSALSSAMKGSYFFMALHFAFLVAALILNWFFNFRWYKLALFKAKRKEEILYEIEYVQPEDYEQLSLEARITLLEANHNFSTANDSKTIIELIEYYDKTKRRHNKNEKN